MSRFYPKEQATYDEEEFHLVTACHTWTDVIVAKISRAEHNLDGQTVVPLSAALQSQGIPIANLNIPLVEFSQGRSSDCQTTLSYSRKNHMCDSIYENSFPVIQEEESRHHDNR